MIFFKLLLSSSLIYIVTMAPVNFIDKKSVDTQRKELNHILSNTTVLPLYYLIRLFTDFFIGVYEIDIYIVFATQHISFHLPIWSDIINVSLKRLSKNQFYQITSINYRQNNVVMLDFDDVLLPGLYILQMKLNFKNSLINDVTTNFFRTSHISKEEHIWLITKDIQSKNQQIFPFWDKPELRSSFEIFIKHHRKNKVISNMPIRKYDVDGDMMWTYFYRTPLISIDNLAIVVFINFRTSDIIHNYYQIQNIPKVVMWSKTQFKPQLKFAQYVAEHITRYLENNSMNIFEKTYVSFEKKVDHVAILDLEDEIKQILGFIFYREANIAYDKKLDPITHKIRVAHLIARGMTQKCMSNLLDSSYWFDQWLKEGFKIYLETYITEKVFPNFRMMDLSVVQLQHELLDVNTYVIINPVMDYYNYPKVYSFKTKSYSSLSHVKGFIIWRMLELTLSSDIFSKGINIYLKNQLSQPKARTSNHLWNAMQSAMKASNYKLEFNIKSMIDSWATQRYSFALQVMRNYSSNIVTISIGFNNTLVEKGYYIPITYTTQSELDFNITWTNITWLTPWQSEIKFVLQENQWIIFNLQQAGYYRVYYDIENWQKIGRYLNSKEYKNIHVLNRAQIIDDAFHFAIEKKLNFSVFYEIAKYLSQEKDYIAWYPMIKAFEFMSNVFAFLPFYSQFQKVKKQITFLTIEGVHETTIDIHNESLKQELAKWKCIIDNISCKIMAFAQLHWHLISPEEHKLLPGWKSWTYCNGLKIADHFVWNNVLHNNLIVTDPIIFKCLAYTENLEIIRFYHKLIMAKLLHSSSALTYQHIKQKQSFYDLTGDIFLFILAKNTKNMLEYILSKFKQIISEKVNDIVALTVIINNVYTEEQLDKIRKFIEKEFDESILSDIKCKIDTRSWEIDHQLKILQYLFTDF